MENKKTKKIVHICENCGHKIKEGAKVPIDKVAELKGVTRLTPGNALCPKCYKSIPFDVE